MGGGHGVGQIKGDVWGEAEQQRQRELEIQCRSVV